MQMKLNYDYSAHKILHDPEWQHKADLMKRAGVQRMWLGGYFYGSWDSDPEEISKVKRMLEEEGFEVEAIDLPFGHGGNALDPSDPNIRLETGNGWRLRRDRYGRILPNTTCISEKSILDSVEAVKILKQIGFHEIFYDDDLRLAMWGPEIQGCFCPECLSSFRQIVPGFTPDMLEKDPEVRERWYDFQCDHVLEFLKAVTIPGIRSGIMVMHNGDQRHGLDLKKLHEEMPDLFFRVGEGHFNDISYCAPEGKESLSRSIHNHLSLIGDAEVYSESTVYPMGALSTDNWIDKIRLELSCGLRNIFLMSGSRFLTDDYWEALIQNKVSLEEEALKLPVTQHCWQEPIWQI